MSLLNLKRRGHWCIVKLVVNFSYSILVLHSVPPSTACQVLMTASLKPQTHNPSIIAPPEFTVRATCRPSFTTALERVSKAFTIEVPLYPTTPTYRRDTWWYKDPSRRQYLTWQCSFFHPPSFQRHLLTSSSLPGPNLLSNHPEFTHSVHVLW